MRWRVIIRFSFEYDEASALRNRIAAALNVCGIRNTNTGSWETPAGTPTEVAHQLNAILETLAQITQNHPGDRSVNMDHIWIYIDKTA
jgi:hypothetical protein